MTKTNTSMESFLESSCSKSANSSYLIIKFFRYPARPIHVQILLLGRPGDVR